MPKTQNSNSKFQHIQNPRLEIQSKKNGKNQTEQTLHAMHYFSHTKLQYSIWIKYVISQFNSQVKAALKDG